MREFIVLTSIIFFFSLTIASHLFAVPFSLPGQSDSIQTRIFQNFKDLHPDDPFIIALKLIRTNKYEEAARLIDKLLAENPSHAFGHEVKGTLYAIQRNYKVAEAAFREALRIEPKLASAELKLAVVLFNTERKQESLKYFESVLKVAPEDHVAHYYLGELAYGMLNFQEAIKHFQESMKANPDTLSPTVISLARTYFSVSDFKAIQDLLEPLIINFEDTEEIYLSGHFYLALALSKMEKLEKAKKHIDYLNRIAPDAPQVMIARSFYERGDGRFQDSINTLQTFLSKSPSTFSGWANFELGLLYLQSGDKDSAFNYLNKADRADLPIQYKLSVNRIRIESGQFENAIESLSGIIERIELYEAYLLLVDAYAKTENMESAFKTLDKLDELFPDLWEKDLLRGSILRYLEENEKAKNIFIKTVKNTPNLVPAWVGLVEIAIETGNGKEAKIQTQKGLKHNPNSPELLYLHAQFSTGEEKIQTLKKAVEINPNFLVALNNLASSMAGHDDMLDEAELYAKRAYQLAKNSPAVKDTLGWVLTRQGKIDEGFSLISQAVQEIPNDWEVQYHFGYVLIERGENQRGKVILKKILKMKISELDRKLIENLLEIIPNG